MARATLPVRVEGTRGVIANLYAANQRVGKHIRSVNRRTARQVKELAYQLAPKDTHWMADHIKFELTPDELKFWVGLEESDFTSHGNGRFYPSDVEFGTVNSAAQPFLHPAYRALEPHYKADISRAVRTAIQESRSR